MPPDPSPEQRLRSARQMLLLGLLTMVIGAVIVAMRARTVPLGEALLRESTMVALGAILVLGGLGERARAMRRTSTRLTLLGAQWLLLVAVAAALGVRAAWAWPVRVIFAAALIAGPLALAWEWRAARRRAVDGVGHQTNTPRSGGIAP